VCISGRKLGERGEVRVGVLLCRDKKACFFCVHLYTLDPNSYYMALCVYQQLEVGGKVRGGRLGWQYCCVGTSKLVPLCTTLQS
jgi:hypothetical protein